MSYNAIDISYWFQVMSCEKERYHLVNLGKIQATNFLNKLEETSLLETKCDEQITTLTNQEGESNITILTNQEVVGEEDFKPIF